MPKERLLEKKSPAKSNKFAFNKTENTYNTENTINSY